MKEITKKKIIRILQIILVIGFILGFISGYYYSSFKSDLDCYTHCIQKIKDSNCICLSSYLNFSYRANLTSNITSLTSE